MSDRYSFRSPFGESPGFGAGNPWFRVGNVDVTTTVFLIGASVLYLFVWAFESGRAVSRKLWIFGFGLDTIAEFWRVVTWPVVNRPDFWIILLFVFFFLFGSQMESLMGRRHYTFFIGALVVIPGAVALTLAGALEIAGSVNGLRYVEMGVLAAFAAQYPQQRFIFNIPAPVFVGGIFVLDMLQLIDAGNDLGVLMLFLIAGHVAHRTEVTWLCRRGAVDPSRAVTRQRRGRHVQDERGSPTRSWPIAPSAT